MPTNSREIDVERLRQTAAERFLAEATRVLARTSDVDVALAGIVQLAVPQFADWCFLDLLTSDGQAYDRVAVGYPNEHAIKIANRLKRRYALRRDKLVGVERALVEGRPLMAHDIDADKVKRLAPDDDHFQLATALGMRSSIVVPMLVRGAAIGALSLVSCGRNYDGADLWLGEQLAHGAAAALVTAQLRLAEQRARTRARDLQRIAEALSEASTAEAVVERACHLGKQALETAYAAAWLAHGGDLALATAEGLTEVQDFASKNSSASTLVAAAARSCKPAWELVQPSSASAEAAQSVNTPNFCGALPLVHGGLLRGVLLFSTGGERTFDSAEQIFLLGIAQQCSQSLERVRLLESGRILQELEQRSTARLELLARAGEALTGSLDLDEVLRTIARLSVPSVADWCLVDLTDGMRIQRIVTESRNAEQAKRLSNLSTERHHVEGDGSVVGSVVAERRARFQSKVSSEFLEALTTDVHELEALRAEEPLSVVVAPLKANGTCIGALSLITTAESGRAYEAADFALAEELGRRAGAAIESARMFRQLSETHDQMRRVFAQVPFAVAMYRGPEHRFVFVNPVYLVGTGKTEEIVGQRHADVFPARRQKYVPMLDEVYRTGKPCNIPEIRVTFERDEVLHEVFLDCALVPLRDENGMIEGLISASFDVTERVLARQSAEQARQQGEQIEERLRLALEAAQVGAWDFDLVRRELIWDERCRAIHGLASDAPLELNATFELIHPEDRAGARAAIAAAVNGAHEREFVFDYRITRASDGSVRSVLSKGRVYFEGNQAVRMVGILSDNSEAKALAAERALLLERERHARSEAERANRTKDNFLATVSHELRTPLNAIAGWAHILQQEPENSSAVVRAAEVVQRSTRAQAKLINEILDVSRITSGNLRIDATSFDLAKELKEIRESITPSAAEKGISVAFVGIDEPVLLVADFERIRQVASNLIDNSLKFTPRGGQVAVSLTVGASSVTITVDDNGRGIEPQFLPFVFERFLQADGSTTRASGGLGLGLAIVRHIVELHGGSVTAHSAGLGRGSCFQVTLPLGHGERSPVGPPMLPTPPVSVGRLDFSLNGLRVLVVEDDDDGRELLVGLLARRGAVVDSAASAREAWQYLDGSAFDMLISDIGMPEEDGYALIARVRARLDAAAKLPAVALTAYAGPSDEAAAREAGFDAYLTKPVDGAELAALLVRLRANARAS